MLRSKAIIVCLQLLLWYCPARSQEIEVGTMIGFGNYIGDLAPVPVISETHPAGGIFARYNISSSFALTAGLNATMVSGNDKHFEYNNYRNLSFRSMIYEYSTVLEFNYFKYGVGVLDKRATSYLFLGLSVFRFNPQTEYNGQWIDLASIRTENVAYKPYAVGVPFGMGFKVRLNKHFAFEGNLGLRMTFTDYLDDVSGTYPNIAQQYERKGYTAAVLSDRSIEKTGVIMSKEGYNRGNQDFDDWYMIGGISLTYRIYSRVKCARFY